MAFSLNENFRYSPLERKVFSLLPIAKGENTSGITTTMIAAKLYGRRPNGRQTVMCAAKTLARKISRNREPFRVRTSPRRGPHPIEFWLERL